MKQLTLLCFLGLSCGELRITLNSGSNDVKWAVHNQNHSINIPSTVPGGIYSDLMNAGIIDSNLYYRFNDEELRWVSFDNWTYTTGFKVNSSMIKKDHLKLIFNGLDTISDVYLNGVHLGSTDNMFVRYSFNINKYINEGENILIVNFSSPVFAARKFYEAQAQNYTVPPVCVPPEYHGECHVNHLRKMQSSFSWDWGPAFPSVGIWKNVELIAYNKAFIEDITITTENDSNNWITYVYIYFSDDLHDLKFDVDVSISNVTTSIIDSKILKKKGNSCYKVILSTPFNNVERWWPNGYGSQKLYELHVKVKFLDEETQVQRKIGFRKVLLVQEPIVAPLGKGLSFYIMINDISIFAKGSNWIPTHVLPELSANEEKVRYLLQSSKDVNMNMLRVWGGGLYESDIFYQIADELGILIWQDFMFACSMYPTTNHFLHSVKTEVKQQVKRLQHHPCIIMWSANNENELALRSDWYGTHSNFTLYMMDYIKLYVDTIRETVKKYDLRPFIVSSPTNGIESEAEGFVAQNPGNNLYGDVHVYNYIFDGWDPNMYPTPRFASEYGYQSLPSLDTLSAVSVPSDWSVDSDLLQSRQHHSAGYEQMAVLINRHLPLPPAYKSKDNFLTYIYYSQISQAMSIKAETEHYRRQRNVLKDSGEGYTMGALYWQLNDIWQAPSWSSIDFSGRWKILHYYAKYFFSDILVSPYVTSDGILSVSVISDQIQDINLATVVIQTYKWDTLKPIGTFKVNCSVKSLSANTVYKEDLSAFLQNSHCGRNYKLKCFLYISLIDTNGQKVSPDNFILPGPLKSVVGLRVPNIEINTVTGPISKEGFYKKAFKLNVSTDNIAAFVWLEATNISGHFSENGFFLVSPYKQIEFFTNDNITAGNLLKVTKVKSVVTNEGSKCYNSLYIQLFIVVSQFSLYF